MFEKRNNNADNKEHEMTKEIIAVAIIFSTVVLLSDTMITEYMTDYNTIYKQLFFILPYMTL